MSRGSRAIDAHVDAADGGPAVQRFQPPAPPKFSGGRPLDSVTIHRVSLSEQPEHWHLVTYGLSELEYKETDDPAVSGWGFELTMRLAGDEQPLWAVDLLNNLAAYVWTTGHPFGAGHHVDLSGPMRLKSKTALTAAVAVADPGLAPLQGPFGLVEFVQLVGVDAAELEACRAWSTRGVIELLARDNPLLVTDLERRSLLDDPSARSVITAGTATDGSSLTELRVGSLAVRSRPGGRLRVTLGAGASAALGKALSRELIGEGASFAVVGDSCQVRFVVAGEASWKARDGNLRVAVPLEEVGALAAMFTGKTGWGRRPAWRRLRFRVVP